MHDGLRNLVQCFWSVGCPNPFSDQALLARLTQDGGLDAEDLSGELVTDLLDGKQIKDWKLATFACSELLAFYLVLNQKSSAEQLAGAAFVSCVLADAARAGAYDWSLEHDKVARLSGAVAQQVSLENNLMLMRYLFGKGGQGIPPCDRN